MEPVAKPRPREREREADVVDAVIQWLMRETRLRVGRLQKLEHALRESHGGRQHYIARPQDLKMEDRNLLIREAWIAGVPDHVIARRFQISSRRVRQIAGRLPRIAQSRGNGFT